MKSDTCEFSLIKFLNYFGVNCLQLDEYFLNILWNPVVFWRKKHTCEFCADAAFVQFTMYVPTLTYYYNYFYLLLLPPITITYYYFYLLPTYYYLPITTTYYCSLIRAHFEDGTQFCLMGVISSVHCASQIQIFNFKIRFSFKKNILVLLNFLSKNIIV